MVWNFDPVLIDLGFLKIHYYGVIFATGIFIGYLLWRWQMSRHGYSRDVVEDFVVWGVVAVIAGARLGHCIFYQPDYYFPRPIEILFFWQGGLASHGATVSLILVLYLYHRLKKNTLGLLDIKYQEDLNKAIRSVEEKKENPFPESLRKELQKKASISLSPKTVVSQNAQSWALKDEGKTQYFIDLVQEKEIEKHGKIKMKKSLRIQKKIPLFDLLDCFSFAAGVGATAVRLGNFLNSEIVGRVTNVSWGMKFPRYEQQVASLTGHPATYPLRHPSQLYEVALGLLVLFVLYLADRHYGKDRPQGLLASLFLVVYFTGRFFVEYFKEYQVLPSSSHLTMGQILSIPFAMAGYILLFNIIRKAKRGA